MPALTSISYMKYITLFLLLFVLLFLLQKYTYHQSIVPTFSPYANELPIYCVDTEEKVLALTFDSAWGTEDLQQILDILQKHNAKATFFVTGEWVEKNPDAILAIDGAGHEIANHGNSHKHMPQLSVEDMKVEINGCHEKVKKLIGKDMTLFRAPYSDWNETVVETAHTLGYMSINQSIDSLDWKDYGIDSIIHTVCEHKNLENGGIVLLHNGSTYTKDALDVMLTNLEEQGYRFVLVSTLIYTENYYLDHTGKQFSSAQ